MCSSDKTSVCASLIMWLILEGCQAMVLGGTDIPGDRERRAAAAEDSTTPSPTTEPPSSINRAIIIVPAVIVGFPLVIILLCVTKNYVCTCCDGDDKARLPKKWEKRNRAPVNQDLTAAAHKADGEKGTHHEFANDVLATMGDDPELYASEQTHYGAYPGDRRGEGQGGDWGNPEVDAERYGDSAYTQQPAYNANWGYNNYGQEDGEGEDTSEIPSSAGSGGQLFHAAGSPARNQVEPEIPRKKRSKRKKREKEEAEERY